MTASSSSSSDRNPVEELADDFLRRQRGGERPTLEEYCRRHPSLADEIREVFPVLIRMEDMRSDGPDESTGGVVVHITTRLERLGDFRILREVDRGGMGVVYEAEQESLPGADGAWSAIRSYLSRTPRFLPAFVAMLIALGATGQRASSQAPDRPDAKVDDRVARLAEMKQIAGSFQAAAIDGGTRTPVALVPEPLHRWSDPTRNNSDGALWAWRSSGRPIAIIAIELYPQDKTFGTIWAIELTSLSTGPIEVEGGEHFDIVYEDMAPPRADGRLRWAPAKKGLEFREIPDAPTPAKTEAERLRQMKDMLKRFSAREFYDITAQDYVLRVLAHPIDRYADAASGLVDGAIFIYANGTNPEVLLVIEVTRVGTGSPTWSYAAAPLTRAAPTIRLGQQDVWTHPSQKVPSPEDTYFLARKPRRP